MRTTFPSNHSELHRATFTWKKNRIFTDSSITLGSLLFLSKRYKNTIDVRLSDFMPISLLSSNNQAIFNPYTFCADGRMNKNEEWCGALPIYHHKGKKSYQCELERHFDYLWEKGITIECFAELETEDKYKRHKVSFLEKILNEEKKYESVL